MNRSIAIGLLLLAACGGQQASSDGSTHGRFRVRSLSGGGLEIRAEPGNRTLLESLQDGSGAYAAAATRKATAAWEMQYGAFKVTEGNQPWKAAVRTLRSSFTAKVGTLADASGAPVATFEIDSPAEGALLLRVRAADPEANRVSLAFRCEAGDRFLGFGAQADALDHRGHKIPIWTSEPGIGKSASDDPPDLWMLEGTRHASSMGLPVWLSQRGYLGVVESDARTVFELCSARDDAWRVETWSNELRLWLFDGPEPAKALERATAGVLGRPMRPPPLAFAPWNDAIYGSAEVRKIAALLRDRQIPSSVLWTEDFRGGFKAASGYRLKEDWELDRGLYPDAEALAAELRSQGFAWLAYFNTFLVEGSKVFAEAQAGGHFVLSPKGGPYLFDGVTFVPSGLADLSRSETRDWVKGYLNRALDVGFDGWMADFGEWLPHDAVISSGEPAATAHNRYPLEWNRLNREVLKAREGDGRQRLFFARAGWLGSNPEVPVWWAGDQRTGFQPDDGMPTVIPIGLGLGLAGASTFGHDIGGYQSATNGPSTKELFFRWTSLGALSPVMRTHHGIDPAKNWWFGADEETLAHFKRWATLHVRLFPYLDAGSAVAEATGLPLMRALPLEFPQDEPGWSIFDQYLLGPALLVAPVQVEGATSRTVHFPPGRWIPFDGGAAVDGPADLTVEAALGELPLYARAGAVVPLLREGVQTLLPAADGIDDLDAAQDARELRVFLGAGGEFAERDGTRYVLEAGLPEIEGVRAGGAALPACAAAGQRGCFEDLGSGAVRVRLDGQGPVEVATSRLSLHGTARRLDLVVRR